MMNVAMQDLRAFQPEAFPSWQSETGSRGGVQSGAASKAEGSLWETVFGACTSIMGLENPWLDGKAALRDGMMDRGGAHV